MGSLCSLNLSEGRRAPHFQATSATSCSVRLECSSLVGSLGCSDGGGDPCAQEGWDRKVPERVCMGQADSSMGLHRKGRPAGPRWPLEVGCCGVLPWLPLQSRCCPGTPGPGAPPELWLGCLQRVLLEDQCLETRLVAVTGTDQPMPAPTWPVPNTCPNYHPRLDSSTPTNMNNPSEINGNSRWPCLGEHLLMNNLPKRQPTAERE